MPLQSGPVKYAARKSFTRNGLKGTLRLRIVVGRKGHPLSIDLVEGVHDELDANALKAAKKWKFDPGEVQKKPVDGVVTVNIEYRLGGDPGRTRQGVDPPLAQLNFTPPVLLNLGRRR